uniref:ATP synthase F0 subunit 4 n=1 Tax=Agarophyton chilense TaxID=2510777 RepID=A0A0D5Y8K3_AGACH|nr:Ymf39 [Agarophyton chilense]AKA27623.1 Ymf39 [Agarophyton chilense]ASP44551.1 ATP synthase F0 subunit 4 [Agarophyton chilense]UAD89524.1 ATP synthase F0 subunit b [Agarophyton chilense]
MLNLSIVIGVSLILISKNIILLNEETLILLCFITFCYLGFTKLKDSIAEDFDNQKNKIRNEFLESFQLVLNSVSINLKWWKIFPGLITNFVRLETHLKSLSSVMVLQLPIIKNHEIKRKYFKKLAFTKRLEQHTNKLIVLLLIKKIEKITFLKYFYSTKIKISPFKCNSQIALREYIEII